MRIIKVLALNRFKNTSVNDILLTYESARGLERVKRGRGLERDNLPLLLPSLLPLFALPNPLAPARQAIFGENIFKNTCL